MGRPGGGVVDSDAHWIHEITTAGTALPASSTGADRCKGTLMSGDVAGRRDAGVRGYGCSAARGSSRLLGAQLMAPSEHGLAPAPRCATPAPHAARPKGGAAAGRGCEAMDAAQRGASTGSLRHLAAPHRRRTRRGRKAARRRDAGARLRAQRSAGQLRATRGAADGAERARARSGTSPRYTSACTQRGRKAARRRGAGMEVGTRHGASDAGPPG